MIYDGSLSSFFEFAWNAFFVRIDISKCIYSNNEDEIDEIFMKNKIRKVYFHFPLQSVKFNFYGYVTQRKFYIQRNQYEREKCSKILCKILSEDDTL